MNAFLSKSRQIIPKLALLGILLTLLPIFANAQLYDNAIRPNLEWSELNTEHFRIIYHEGLEQVARRSALILEEQYPRLKAVYGGSLSNFPVVINGYNDLANGYVTTGHFRMEIEAPPVAGSILNPVGADRLETLLTHELVHALQFSTKGGLGFTRLMYLFSPDLARSNHGLTPSGFREGIAVHAETELQSGVAGRGNFAPFTNPFYTNLRSNNPWNLSQLLTPSPISLPRDRFYVGGYQFSDWLMRTQDSTLVRKSLHRFATFPYIGYAPFLWHATGKSMKKLYREFSVDAKIRLNELHADRDSLNLTLFIHPKGDGNFMFAPFWMDDSTILVYGSWFNLSPGFYTLNTQNGQFTQIFETRIDENYRFDVSTDRKSILYSRYQPHPTDTDRFITDIFEFDFDSNSENRVTQNQRVRSPLYLNDSSIFALATIQSTHLPVTVNSKTGEVTPWSIKSPSPETDLITVTDWTLSRDKSQLAIVVVINEQQGIWIQPVSESMAIDLTRQHDIHLPNTTLLNPSWAPDATLWFSSGQSGIQQIYQFNQRTKSLTQRSNHLWNLMFPAISPDGSYLSTITQTNNERVLATIPTTDLNSIPISTPTQQLPTPTPSPISSANLTPTRYRTNPAWLKPRTIIPWATELNSDGDLALGVSLLSSDVLRKNTYQADILYGNETLFYDLQYRYSGFSPMLQLRAAQTPYDPGNPTDRDNIRFFGIEREYGIGFIYQRLIDHRSTANSFYIQPEVLYRTSQITVEDEQVFQNNQTTPWIGSVRARVFTSYNYRLRSNIRSVTPVTGSQIFAQFDQDLTMLESDNSEFTGIRLGGFTYIQPIKSWNQTLRLGIQSVWQNRRGYNTLSLVHDGFDDLISIPEDFVSISTRYTIPLGHPDTGGILIPAFLERYYVALFTDTVINHEFSTSNTVIGAGLRTRIRIFYNLTLDLGVGIAIQPGKSGSETIVFNF
jgi:hypothetical protein